MERRYYVYILAKYRNGALYIGMTNDISRRMIEHRERTGARHPSKYAITRLVHVETFPTAYEAIAREKALKKWNRKLKLRLIEDGNPDWDDLFETLNS
ncbi:MAG: GIY-YIG nuclease family protein [Pseudomonadota bacterium]